MMAQTATLLAAAVLTGVIAAVCARGIPAIRAATPAPQASRATGLREKAQHSRFVRLCDPDAAGRIRPRAPTAAPAAA
jgi:hypothetical protein